MRTEDALRKIRLLRQVRTENGALATEVENAARLAKVLMERYAIKAEDIPVHFVDARFPDDLDILAGVAQ